MDPEKQCHRGDNTEQEAVLQRLESDQPSPSGFSIWLMGMFIEDQTQMTPVAHMTEALPSGPEPGLLVRQVRQGNCGL